MGPNTGNGMGGMDMATDMHANGSNQPPATEYTLQGVMRFLQTEWHRHERDRNAWEIERQEMRGRMASLEGKARRADATQKALRKYVSILEHKIRYQSTLNGVSKSDSLDSSKNDWAAKNQQRLQASPDKNQMPGVDGICAAKSPEDEAQRNELKSFLDQCQAEFMYLMVSPANPQPPRESPPLPMMEDMREVEAYAMSGPQHKELQFQLQRWGPSHLQDVKSFNPPAARAFSNASQMQQLPSSFSHNPSSEFQSQPMVRSAGEHQPSTYTSSGDFSAPPVVMTRPVDEELPGFNHTADILGARDDSPEAKDKPPTVLDADDWEFPEGTFPEQGASRQSHSSSMSNRPDTDAFPNAEYLSKSPGRGPGGHRRKRSISRRRSGEHELMLSSNQRADAGSFKLRFGLRGHLDTVRTVIFSGGGSPGEPEICTAGDDGIVKRFHIPRLDNNVGSLGNAASDLDVIANFTHRGHSGAILSLTSWAPSPSFSTGGRAQGDGWIFSGGQDAMVRVWERGRVDPKATLEGHTDAVWALCVLPTTLEAIFGSSSPYGSADRILLVSGAADSSVRVWSVSAPPQLSSPQPGSNRSMSGRGGRVRGNSMSSGSGFSSSPQPTTAFSSPFHYTLVHVISRSDDSVASPTCIVPLGSSGESFVVSYSDAAVVVYDTRSGEQIGQMDSMETYDGSMVTSVNSVVATTSGLGQGGHHHGSSIGSKDDGGGGGGGPTGGRSMAGSGVEGTIITGHEDRFVRFFDANSGQCTYNMLAHPDAISSLSLSPDGQELVSAGHDASLRFWDLEKRTCTQEITSHRVMRGEGVCSCVWSQDGKWVVSGGGDGVVKVFAR